jgi:hypothetical protein
MKKWEEKKDRDKKRHTGAREALLTVFQVVAAGVATFVAGHVIAFVNIAASDKDLGNLLKQPARMLSLTIAKAGHNIACSVAAKPGLGIWWLGSKCRKLGDSSQYL